MNDKDQKISKYQSQILSIVSKVNTLEDEIQELITLKNKMASLRDKLEETGLSAYSFLQSVPGKFKHMIKINLFSGLINCAKGKEYQAALVDLNGGMRKIQKEIDEKRGEIDELKKQSRQYSILVEQEKDRGDAV